jgi:hypothetical protein
MVGYLVDRDPRLKGLPVSDDHLKFPAESGFLARASRYVAGALLYWEPRRLLYNAALGLVVAGHIVASWSTAKISADFLLFLFLLAVLANVCYCAVYVVDLFVQFSGLHVAWKKGRILVLLVGTSFAAVVTHFFMTGLLIDG